MAETMNSTNVYHDRVVTVLVVFAVIWSLLGMGAGLYVAAELVWPTIDFGQEWLSYGRLRTLHTNGVVFGFGVSALMGTAFYSVQRTCHVPLFAPKLAWFCCIAWQIAVLAGGISLLAGWNAGKEYAELEWPFDIAIAVIWVAFAVVFFRHDRQTQDKSDIRIQLVLRCVDHRDRDVAHRQQSCDSNHD